MKAVFVFIFLFGMYDIATGQEELIVLQNEPVDFEVEGFFIKNVKDGRANKESIGFVQKGIFKKTKVKASFKDGLETAVYNFLEKSVRQDNTSVPVILRITRLNISESQSLPVKGRAEVKMEFYRERNGSIGKLYEAEAFVEKPAVNVSKTHEERIREVIITCLKSFNESDWQSGTPMFFEEREP